MSHLPDELEREMLMRHSVHTALENVYGPRQWDATIAIIAEGESEEADRMTVADAEPDGASLREIADELGCSTTRVIQIISGALRKLRAKQVVREMFLGFDRPFAQVQYNFEAVGRALATASPVSNSSKPCEEKEALEASRGEVGTFDHARWVSDYVSGYGLVGAPCHHDLPVYAPTLAFRGGWPPVRGFVDGVVCGPLEKLAVLVFVTSETLAVERVGEGWTVKRLLVGEEVAIPLMPSMVGTLVFRESLAEAQVDRVSIPMTFELTSCEDNGSGTTWRITRGTTEEEKDG